MKKQCHANSGHARKTFDVVKCLPSDGKRSESFEKPKDIQQKFDSTPSVLLSPTSNSPQKTLKSCAQISGQSTLNSTDTALVKIAKPAIITVKPINSNDGKENNGKDGLNQHLFKFRKQFTSMHDTANKKMLELQLELYKMEHMSNEFDVLVEFISSEEKSSSFHENLHRLQKTVDLTEVQLNEINTNNQKMSQMIRKINDTAKIQHESNEKAINAIEERLARWESKLDRAARKISNQKIDVGELKLNKSDYEQLKDDFESMLNGRLDELSAHMEWMKNIVFAIVALIVVKTILIDFIQKNGNAAI